MQYCCKVRSFPISSSGSRERWLLPTSPLDTGRMIVLRFLGLAAPASERSIRWFWTKPGAGCGPNRRLGSNAKHRDNESRWDGNDRRPLCDGWLCRWSATPVSAQDEDVAAAAITPGRTPSSSAARSTSGRRRTPAARSCRFCRLARSFRLSVARPRRMGIAGTVLHRQ